AWFRAGAGDWSLADNPGSAKDDPPRELFSLVSVETTTRLRPATLAAYMARSARSINCSILSFGRRAVIPTDTVVTIRSPAESSTPSSSTAFLTRSPTTSAPSAGVFDEASWTDSEEP